MNNNYPSWEADSWLQKFEHSKGFVGGTRPVRADVFQSTLKIVKCGKYISPSGNIIALDEIWNKEPLKDNVFCEKEISLKDNGRKYDTLIKVINQDCLAFAHEIVSNDTTDDLCVLNMASAKNPGGGVYGGAGAQEEYLFRCSDYFRFLFQYADPKSFDCEKEYGIPHHPKHTYPLKKNFGGVYSHGVTIFRDTEAKGYALLDQPWHVNFVAVAANNIRRYMHGQTMIPEKFIPSTLNLIRTILRIAYNNGQRRLVLGAFGCGAFANPPGHMAQLFKQIFNEPEFKGIFREIYFAIIEDHNSKGQNYNAFNEIFSHQSTTIDDNENPNLHYVKEGGKFGFADEGGNVVIPCIWYSVYPFSDGLAAVCDENGKWGYIDKTGKLVIPCTLKSALDFSEGMAIVFGDNGRQGYMDKTGEIVIPCQWYDGGDFSEGLALVEDEKGNYGFIDKKGNIVIPCQWSDAGSFCDGLAPVEAGHKGFGYIDKTGKVVIPYHMEWIDADNFENGFAKVYDNNHKATIIDKSGKVVQ